GAVPAAEVATGGQAAGAGETSSHVELALVDRDGIDLTVELAVVHSAPVRRANHPGAAHVVELGLDPVLVASHRGDPHLIDGPLKTFGTSSASYIKGLVESSDRCVGTPTSLRIFHSIDVDGIHARHCAYLGTPHPD